MDQLVAEWAGIQSESLGIIEKSYLGSDLVEFVAKFEQCLDKMYQSKRETNVSDNVAEFEKELQLKQHLAVLLSKESPISSQTEMNVALWKSQPYVYSIVAPSMPA